MVERGLQEPGLGVSFPTYLLVRLPDGQDPPDIVRNTLRLASVGVKRGRQWFVPLFTTEDGASRFANDVRKIDDKLRLIPIRNHKEWVTLLQALQARGDTHAAFDPQPSYVQHLAIADLLAGARRRAPDNYADSSPRAGEPDAGRSWLRSRLAAFLPTAPAVGRARTDGTGEAKKTPPEDTERAHPHVTPRHRPTNPRG